MNNHPRLAPHPDGAVVRRLNQHALAARWGISTRTLERWRWLKTGPAFIKIGGRVVYALEDIENYETARRHEAVG